MNTFDNIRRGFDARQHIFFSLFFFHFFFFIFIFCCRLSIFTFVRSTSKCNFFVFSYFEVHRIRDTACWPMLLLAAQRNVRCTSAACCLLYFRCCCCIYTYHIYEECCLRGTFGLVLYAVVYCCCRLRRVV